jgi:hypothetical protein
MRKKVPLKKEPRPMMPDQVVRQLQALDKLNDTLPPKVMTPELYRKLKAPFALLGRFLESWGGTATGTAQPRFLGGLNDQRRANPEVFGNLLVAQIRACFDHSRDLGENLSAGVLACLL